MRLRLLTICVLLLSAALCFAAEVEFEAAPSTKTRMSAGSARTEQLSRPAAQEAT